MTLREQKVLNTLEDRIDELVDTAQLISSSSPYTTGWKDISKYSRTRFLLSGSQGISGSEGNMTGYLQFKNSGGKKAEDIVDFVSGSVDGHDFATYGTLGQIKVSASTLTSAYLTWNGVRW